jgi:hypothetical protein
MTKAVYQSMFVSLSALLMAALFVLQPADSQEMKDFQSSLRQQFTQAATQLVEGESFTEPFALVWSSVDSFYSESANEAIALLHDDSITSLALMFNGDYQLDREIAAAPVIARNDVYVEEALTNIVPDNFVAAIVPDEVESLLDPNFNEDLVYDQATGGRVAGESIGTDPQPEPAPVVWMTISDSITAYPYCVAIFNGSINSYPGACAKDERAPVYEN